jgi:hypothetical protein
MNTIKVFSGHDINKLNDEIEKFISEEENKARENRLKFNIVNTETSVTPDGLVTITLTCNRKMG